MERAPAGAPGAPPPLQVFAGDPGDLPAYGGPCQGLKIPKNSKLLQHIINHIESMQNFTFPN